MTNPTKDITINGNKYEIYIPKERITNFPTIPTVTDILGTEASADYNPTTGAGTAPTGIYKRLYDLEHPAAQNS